MTAITHAPETTVTYIQAHHAWLLANHYGHEWAQAWSLPVGWWDSENEKSVYINDIEAATVERREQDGASPPIGITAPDVTPTGLIIHRTTSGRLQWTITRHGTILLEIYRPAEEPEGVCAITVMLTSDRERIATEIHSNLTHTRHLVAMGEALSALVGLRVALEWVALHTEGVLPDA